MHLRSCVGLFGRMPLKQVFTLLLFFTASVLFNVVRAQSAGQYVFTNNTSPFTLLTGATAVAATNASNDDGISAAQNIGFTFNFGGTNFTQFKMNTNGWMALGTAATSSTNYTSLGGTELNVIAAYSGDLTSAGGAMSFLTSGTPGSQICKIEWKNTTEFSGTEVPDLSNFQIWLYEGTNVIELRYGSFGVGTRTAAQSPLPQAGLRGTSTAATQVLSVTTTSNWAAATYSNGSSVTMPATTAILPDNGRRYTFTPPTACIPPADQPTGLSLSAINAAQIDGSFTAASSAPNGYLVVRYLAGATPTNPVNGTAYTAGGTLGAGTVVQANTATSFSATGLAPLTFYDFYVYSMNTQCIGAPSYLTTAPLFGTRRTPAQTPPNCATTYTPADVSTNVPITQVLSWSGATGAPAITGYNVYFSTNSALVTAEDPSVRVSTNQAGTTYTPSPVLSFSTTYYWKVTPINSIGASTGCVVNSFSTYSPTSITSTTLGGLWSSPATWVGGVAPVAGDNVTIADGATVTVDQIVSGINNLTIGQGTSGVLQWNATSNAMTLFGNLTVSAGGRFHPYTTGGTGQTLNIGGNFTNNGYANAAVPSTLFNFNGSQQSGGSLSQTLGGTGNFQSDGTVGIIRTLFFQTTGSSTINTAQNLKTVSFAHTAGSLNTNGRLSIDNTVQVYGQAINLQMANVAVTNMGSAYVTAPVVFGATASAWTAGGAAVVGTRYYSGGNVYICTVAGAFDAITPPTHTSGIAVNGAAGLLWLAPVGTLGNPFILTATTVGTQYFYGGNLYVCTVAGIADPNTPPVHVSGTAVSGAATFLYAGTPATATVNHDAVTQTVRSLTITSPGSGYSSAPSVTFNGGGGTGASATSVNLQSIAGPGAGSTQKSGSATISGGITINSNQAASAMSGVGAVSTTNGGVNYTSAPAVGFAGPPGINLVIAGGSGYTSAPTITVTGGTLISGTALATTNFTITVNQGRVVSVYLNTATTATYSVPPTLAFTGGGGAGATLDFPAGCWPAATATVGSNGQITNFTVTNAGYGYAAAPTVGLLGGTPTTAATAPTCRIGLYNLTINNFTPSSTNVPNTDDAVIPASRKLNTITLGSTTPVFGNLNLTAPIELFGTTPITLNAGTLNMGGNNLLFTWNGYAGNTGSIQSNVSNGSITLTTRGGGTTGSTLNYPFDATYTTNTGTGTAATGSTITALTVSRTAAPSGAATPSGSAIGTRAYNAVVNGGAVYGTNPTVTLNWNANDALVSDLPSLRVSQGTAVSGPWTVRSVTSGAGPITATGSRTTATGAPGPIVPTGNDFFAWTSDFIAPPALNYVVTRTTANAYQSIAPIASGGDGTGTLSTAAGDETAQTAINIASAGFVYQGSPVTAMAIHPNGYIVLNNAYNTYTAASSWDNTLSAANNGFTGTPDINKRNVIAPFYDDLNKGTPVIYYKVVGQKVTVEWFNTTFFGLTGPQMFFQVVLDAADQSIQFNYGNMQLYNGTQNIRYSYTSGISGGFVSLPLPQAGQVMQQQYENTTFFTHENGGTSNWGANGLAISPDPRSSIKFTPGSYVPVPPPAQTPPVNDEPAGAITRPALPGFPSNIAWDNGTNTSNLFTTRFATNTASPAVCGGATNARDVWFKFVAPNPSVTARIYGSGGFIPRLALYDNSLNILPSTCAVGTQGLTVTSTASGLTVGNTYYVRVFHENTGTQATATSTISAGAVNGLTITTPGTNYSNPATAFSGYSPQNQGPRISFTGGGGNGAASGWITPTTPTAVLGLTAANLGLVGGAGYTSAPAVTVESPDWGITGEFGIILFSLPENDDCSGAIALTNLSNNTCVTGQNSATTNTQGATASTEPTVCGTPDDDLWYKFTAIDVKTHITMQGTGLFDAAFQVYDGGVAPGSCGTKTSIACINVNGIGAIDSTTVTTVIGNVYYVRVFHAGAGSAVGENFTVCISSAPPGCISTPLTPPNEGSVCAGAATLSWAAVPFASQYEVYLDPGTGTPTTLVSTQTGTTFNTAALTAGPYVWRVVPKNQFGAATGCGTFTFIVNGLPVSNITPAGPITLCAPATQTLTLGATTASSPTYQWVNGTANISGQTANSYIASASGNYRLVVTDGLTGCRDTSNTVVLTINLVPVIGLTPSAAIISCDSAKLTALSGGAASLKITEVTLNRTGIGATASYPAYIGAADADFIEISNISSSPVNVGGYQFADYDDNDAVVVHPFIIPIGTIIPANSILTLHLGTGATDAVNRYFSTGGSTDFWISSDQAGFVLKDPNGNVVDAVGCGGTAASYTFAAGTGVVAGDWSGFAANVSGQAGVFRSAALDNNAGSDWTANNSPSPLQTIGAYNTGAGYVQNNLPVAWTPTTGLYTDALLTTPYTGGDIAVVYAKPGSTTTYTASVTAGGCPGSNNVIVTVLPPGTFLWTGAINSDWTNTGNWSCAQIPTITSDVTIPSGKVNYPVLTLSVEIKSLTINPGATVTVNTGFDLKLNGN